MTSFLRWATAVVALVVIAIAIVAYPTLRARLSPLPTPTASPLAVAPTAPPTALPAVTVTGLTTRQAVVIQPPPTQVTAPTTAADAPLVTVAPAAVATTSLLPAALIMPPAVAATRLPAPVTSNNPTPQPAAASATPTVTPIPLTLVLATPIPPVAQPHLLAENAAPAPPPQTPGAVPDRAEASADRNATPMPQEETSPDAPTAEPSLPVTNRSVQLHIAPDTGSPSTTTLSAGEPVDVIALFTEGTWYLLANGLWIPTSAVSNAPALLPLVVPTPTFTPSPTPTPTFTPLPTIPPEPLTTPVPTPTSLAQPICACDQPTYSCVSADFPHRQAAQLCFEYCFRIRGFDVHNLDPNFNGQACENLPPVQQ